MYKGRIHTLLLILSLAVSAFLPSACSDIAEAERLVVVNVLEKDTIAIDTIGPQSPDTIDYFAFTGRHVLIEDFTGQECSNCPNATDLIAQLQEMHGHDNVIAVGIHSGPLGVKPEKSPEGLATALGDAYYAYWHIEMQPYGVIDRSDGPLSTDWWTAKVNWDLSEEQPAPSLNIWLETSVGDDRKLEVETVLAAFEHARGNLQLWIVEDGIVAYQKMPDGTTNHNYVHNHVLRDAVNGDWGEEVTIETDDLKTFTHSYVIPQAWNIDNLAVVAFVYNDDGVAQVARKSIK